MIVCFKFLLYDFYLNNVLQHYEISLREGFNSENVFDVYKKN